MTYKNSVRILSSNFSLCWKQLVWMILGGAVVVGFSLLAVMPVFDMLKAEGFCAAAKDCFEGIYTQPKNVPMQFVDLARMFGKLISSHAATLWGSYVGFIAVLVLLGNLVRCLGLYACSSVLGSRMASNAKMGYTNRMISSLGRGILYALAHILISIPFYAVIGVVVYGYVWLSKTVILAISLLPVFSIVLYVVFALKTCVFSCMLPQMVDGQRNPFVAFGKGIKEVGTRFWRTFSSSICVVLTIALVNAFIGVFTLGAGLLVTVPASTVFLAAFGMVTHYAANKRNFYVSELVVVNLK